MSITLTPETQRLIEEQMRRCGCSTPDDLVRLALRTLDQVKAEDYDDLDDDTRAAIENGEAQHAQGEGRPWAEVRQSLRAKFVK